MEIQKYDEKMVSFLIRIEDAQRELSHGDINVSTFWDRIKDIISERDQLLLNNIPS